MTNIAWWGWGYILLVLVFVYLEFFRSSDDQEENGDEEMGKIEMLVRGVMYLCAPLLTIFYFQGISRSWLKYSIWSISAIVALISLYYLFDEIKSYLKDPRAEKDLEEGEEPTGLFFNTIGYCIPVSLYAGAAFFSIFGSLRLLS